MIELTAVYVCENHECRKEAFGKFIFTAEGKYFFELPDRWVTHNHRHYCPSCIEEMITRKLLKTDLPDPKLDPPVIAERAQRIKEVLKGRIALEREDSDDPDFAGSIGDTPAPYNHVAVKVYSNKDVDITWPYADGITSLTLQMNENFELSNPPPFLSPQLITWVNSGLQTLKAKDEEIPPTFETEKTDEPLEKAGENNVKSH